VRKADNLPSSCVVTKSGNLNFLEPSGPVQACNGTALPLRLTRLYERAISKLRYTYIAFLLNVKSGGACSEHEPG